MPNKVVGEAISLQEHFEKILVEKDKAIALALASAKEAVAVAEVNAEKWRDNANEWRGAMSDREKTFATNKDIISLADRMDTMEKTLIAILSEKKGIKDFWGWIVGGASFLIMLITLMDKIPK